MAQGNQGRDNEGQQGRPSGRGFAGMDREKQREIASKGGRAAHAQGTAHEFTPEEARIAGRKGGEASHGGRGARRDIPAAGGDRAPQQQPDTGATGPAWDTGESSDLEPGAAD